MVLVKAERVGSARFIIQKPHATKLHGVFSLYCLMVAPIGGSFVHAGFACARPKSSVGRFGGCGFEA